MRLKIILTSLSFFLLTGFSACDEKKIDAIKCLFMKRDPIQESYWYCYNPKTGEEKDVPLEDTGKCLRSDAQCDWVASDINEVESARKQVLEQQCPKN